MMGNKLSAVNKIPYNCRKLDLPSPISLRKQPSLAAGSEEGRLFSQANWAREIKFSTVIWNFVYSTQLISHHLLSVGNVFGVSRYWFRRRKVAQKKMVLKTRSCEYRDSYKLLLPPFPHLVSVLLASGLCIKSSNASSEMVILNLLTTMQRAKRQGSDQQENVIHASDFWKL